MTLAEDLSPGAIPVVTGHVIDSSATADYGTETPERNLHASSEGILRCISFLLRSILHDRQPQFTAETLQPFFQVPPMKRVSGQENRQPTLSPTSQSRFTTGDSAIPVFR